MKNNRLKKLKTNDIIKIIKEKKNEDIEIIKSIESLLKKKRGHVFKMPKPGSHVILLLSGGIDSIIMWAYLMDVFKLVIHPVCFIEKKPFYMLDKSINSIHNYGAIFEKKFPKLYIKPQIIFEKDGQREISKKIKKTNNKSEQYLLKQLSTFDDAVIERSGLMTPYILKGVDFAELILAKKGITINTVFCGVMPSDGELLKSQTLTALRSAMLNTCISTNNYDIQYCALPMEKEIGYFHSKDNFVSWFIKKGFSLDKSWSCYSEGIIHCGNCYGCWSRRDFLRKAKVDDKTIYQSDIYGSISYHTKKILKLLHLSS